LRVVFFLSEPIFRSADVCFLASDRLLYGYSPWLNILIYYKYIFVMVLMVVMVLKGVSKTCSNVTSNTKTYDLLTDVSARLHGLYI